MTWGLAAPDTVDALVALAEQLKVGIADLEVADGGKVTKTAVKAIVFSFNDPNADAIEHQLEDAGFTENQADQFTVNCRTEALVTGTLSRARRDAYSVLVAFADLLYADPTLNDRVSQAVIRHVRFSPEHQERGYLATVPFTVVCDAYTD